MEPLPKICSCPEPLPVYAARRGDMTICAQCGGQIRVDDAPWMEDSREYAWERAEAEIQKIVERERSKDE